MERRLPLAKLLVAAAAMVVLATACGSGSAGNAEGASGGTLTIGWAEEPDTLNPAQTGSATTSSIDINIFDTLIYLTKGGQLQPDLATSWQTLNGGKSFVFNLRKGVKFQDGTQFNAAAVVANIDYIASPSTKSVSSLSGLGTCLKATANSTYQVTINCTSTSAALLNNLTDPSLGMQSPAVLKKYGANLGDHLVGTGAFKLQSFTPNSSIVLVRNPDYNWAPAALGGKGPAKLSKIVYDIVTSDQSRASELLSGQAQVISETPGIYYNRLKTNSKYQEFGMPNPGMGIFMPFNSSRPPTNDRMVREAIAMYINKTAVIKTALQGTFPVLNTILEKGMLGYDASLHGPGFNPTKAASILTSDGWQKVNGKWMKSGQPLTLIMNALSTHPQYPLILEAVQAQLQQAGMTVTIMNNPVTTWQSVNDAGGMNLTVLQFVGSDSSLIAQWFVPGDHYQNWTKVTGAPQLVSVLNQAQSITDRTQRAKLYEQAQQMILAETYTIPIQVNETLITAKATVKGMTYNGGGYLDLYQASVAAG